MLFSIIVPETGVLTFEADNFEQLIDILTNGNKEDEAETVRYLLESAAMANFLVDTNQWDIFIGQTKVLKKDGTTESLGQEIKDKMKEGVANLYTELLRKYPEEIEKTEQLSAQVKTIYKELMDMTPEEQKEDAELIKLLSNPKGQA